jgi:ferrous iron transport protein A
MASSEGVIDRNCLAEARTLVGAATTKPPAPLSLDQLPLHQPARIHQVLGSATLAEPVASERARQLADIGFAPGERVTVVAHAWPGHDPLVVRIGGSRFALRRAEAACVQVEPIAA